MKTKTKKRLIYGSVAAIGVAVIVIILMCFGVAYRWGGKEWWETRSKIDVVFTDVKATPQSLIVNLADIEAKKH